jgi:hypothetical protein
VSFLSCSVDFGERQLFGLIRVLRFQPFKKA